MFDSFFYFFVLFSVNFVIYWAVAEQTKLVIQNSHGEKLVGIFHETGSPELVIICRADPVSNGP